MDIVQFINKGKKAPKPAYYSLIRRKDTKILVEVSGEGVSYDHKDENQLDWNKVEGGTFTWFSSHGRSFMTVWRYIVETNEAEVTFYYHGIEKQERFKIVSPNGTRGHVDESNTIKLPVINGKFQYIIERRFEGKDVETRIRNIERTQEALCRVKYKKVGRRYRIINAWFGGTYPAKALLNFVKRYMKLNNEVD